MSRPSSPSLRTSPAPADCCSAPTPAWRLLDRKVLLVGGGAVATGRLYYLLEAGAKVTLIAPAAGLTKEVRHRVDEGLVDRWIDREWIESDGDDIRRASATPRHARPASEKADLLLRLVAWALGATEYDMVLTAIDDNPTSTSICTLCRTLQIPVNVADVPPQCDFYFGSQIRRGPLQVMVSTSGRGPRIAALIRKRIESSLPEHVEMAIDNVGRLRAELRKRAPGVGGPLGERRMKWMIGVSDSWSLEELSLMDDKMLNSVLEGWETMEVRTWDDVNSGRKSAWKKGVNRWQKWTLTAAPYVGGFALGVAVTFGALKRTGAVKSV